MYWATGQYPSLRGLTKKDRNLLVAAALRKHDKWVGRRFWCILGAFLITAIGLGTFEEALGLPDCFGLAKSVSFGLLFYCYLLWELNGAVYAAVSKFTAESVAANSLPQP
jgi:hypothetical protein